MAARVDTRALAGYIQHKGRREAEDIDTPIAGLCVDVATRGRTISQHWATRDDGDVEEEEEDELTNTHRQTRTNKCTDTAG